VNYFGRLVEQVIQGISIADIKESHVGGYPTVLLIGGRHYLDQVSLYLARHGYAVNERVGEDDEIRREGALRLLKDDASSNLGWRIALEVDKPAFFVENAAAWLASGTALDSLIPPDYRQTLLSQAADFVEPEDAEVSAAAYDESRPTIRLTSFEGAKGLSAQYVFIVGLHEGDLPRSTTNIRDVEVCKFLVALTRTRKECYILTTGHFGDKKTKLSVFISWIAKSRKVYCYVDKTFWTPKR
jgi:ATP-dependent DNA helicase UvrD/PcrA